MGIGSNVAPGRAIARTGLRLCLAILAASLAGAAVAGCPGPVTPIDGGPAVTPSSWTDTARFVVGTIRWAVPLAKSIVRPFIPALAWDLVARLFDVVAARNEGFARAVEAYETSGGDRCAAHAAVALVRVALLDLAQGLADNGIALGTTLERVVDGVASIADALIPACDADAGWASAGDASNATLRSIAARAGRPLSRVLDDLRPLDGGVR